MSDNKVCMLNEVGIYGIAGMSEEFTARPLTDEELKKKKKKEQENDLE